VSGTPSTQVKRHPHVFTALYWHFGPYGRQDVHVHSCQPWDDSGDRCARVLIGPGRNCDGDRKSHWRETL
jgi:hypothetical protein